MTSKDIKLENAHILFGDALARLKELPDNSVDSIVTDPPYGLTNTKGELIAKMITEWATGNRSFIPDAKGFMGKEWDGSVPPPAIWDECLRVLKPGGHLLAFFGSRTQDIGALSIRLAGFEIRDSIAWVYGSGFPKSMDISKAIDKMPPASEREVLSQGSTICKDYPNPCSGHKETGKFSPTIHTLPTAPSKPEAIKYAGWGTALKPAVEPIVVARKPLSESTVANNVLKWGTGGLNIDVSRVGTEGGTIGVPNNDLGIKESSRTMAGGKQSQVAIEQLNAGRFPANILLDEEAASMLDEQTAGKLTAGHWAKTKVTGYGEFGNGEASYQGVGEKAEDAKLGASKFFYVAKASKKDRNEGLDGLTIKGKIFNGKNPESAGMAKGSVEDKFSTKPAQNFHPTVKPTKLMEYLIKLVTPVSGTVLDPFCGSGSTGKAALLNGFKFVGCELTEEYLPIIEGRLKWAENKHAEIQALKEKEAAETLFPDEGEN